MKRAAALCFLLSATASEGVAQKQDRQVFPADPMQSVPKLATMIAAKGSELAEVVERYSADQGSINRRYDASDSPAQRKRLRDF